MKDIDKSVGYRIFTFLNYAFMSLIIIIMVLPYMHVIAKALNEGLDTMLGGITIFPRKFTLENMRIILSDIGIYKAIIISISRVLLGGTIGLVVQFAVAYGLTKKDLPGRSALLTMFMIPMFFNAGMIPTYVLFAKIGLLDSFWVYIFPALFNFFNVIIIRTFITSTIPDSLEESAFLDGANELVVFWQIIVPLCKPILATIALWLAVMHWNDWVTTVLYITSSDLHTLQYKMMQIVKENERLQQMMQAAIESGRQLQVEQKTTTESLTAAQILVSTIPIISVYPFLQKYFVQGIMIGAVKG